MSKGKLDVDRRSLTVTDFVCHKHNWRSKVFSFIEILCTLQRFLPRLNDPTDLSIG